VEALSASVAVLLVYALTRSGNHSETEDSVAFAVRVRDDPAADLLEGTHAVYLVIGRGFARALSGLGLTDDPLLALQALDMLLGATAVGGLWLLLRHAGATVLAAAAGCGTVAFSYGFWRNAVDAEVYALSAVALVGCLAAAWAATQRPSARAFAVLGLANGVAVLAHVTNVLFAAAAALAVLLASRGLRTATRSRLRWGAAYAGAAAAVVVPVYGLAAALHGLGSASEFRGWFTERSGQAGDFGTIGFGNVARAAFGSARALVGGHFALALEPIRDFATGRFAGKTFSEELFFLEGFSRGLAVALLGAGALAGALVVGLGAQWLRRPAVDSRRQVLALLAAAWLVPYALLFFSWDPLNIELWPAVWLPAAVLAALALDTVRADRARAALAVGAVASLFAVNLVGSVLPQRDEERDLWRAKADWYRAHTRSDDLLVSNGYVWSAYLRYLVDVEVVDIEDLFREADTERAALEALRRRVASAPARVLVSGEAFEAFADRRTSCLDAARTCEIAAATARELRDECRLLAVARDPPERVWTCPRTA
jgi:hypothetical protein